MSPLTSTYLAPHLPLSQELYTRALQIYTLLLLALPIQLSTPFYPTGKTSLPTLPLNLPGKPAWILMELVSPLFTTLAILSLHPGSAGTSDSVIGSVFSTTWEALATPQARILGSCYYVHYLYRSVLSPLWNPSMAPMNLVIFLVGVGFNAFNGSMIGSWLGGVDGSVHNASVGSVRFWVGLVVWGVGLGGNVYHEGILRAIRRDGGSMGEKEKEKEKKEEEEEKEDVVLQGRRYRIPRGGGFEYILHAHYFSEWVEWGGLWWASGGGRNPIGLFVMFEVATMLPRALQGRRWYVEKFGEGRVRGRKAVVPGVI